MKVGINDAQELKELALKKGLPFANLLRTYVLEDLMVRIYSSDYQENLWLKDDHMFGESGCRRGGEHVLFFYYLESARPIPEGKLVPGQKLGAGLMESFAGEILLPENAAQIQWESKVLEEGAVLELLAVYKEMKVPVTLKIHAIVPEHQKSERKILERVAAPGGELAYRKYSSENQLSADLFQIIDKLELITDMGAYDRSYRILRTQPLSGRHIMEELAELAERTPQVKNERRLEQLGGYRTYAYMRKRWNQYAKRRGGEAVSWEDVLDLVLALVGPIWQSLCRNEIFLDDWMPELGRYM